MNIEQKKALTAYIDAESKYCKALLAFKENPTDYSSNLKEDAKEVLNEALNKCKGLNISGF